MKPYYCVYDTLEPHFAWIFRDSENIYYHSDWQNDFDDIPGVSPIDDIIDSTSSEELLSDPNAAAKLLVGYYPLNFTIKEFYQQHPELLI